MKPTKHYISTLAIMGLLVLFACTANKIINKTSSEKTIEKDNNSNLIVSEANSLKKNDAQILSLNSKTKQKNISKKEGEFNSSSLKTGKDNLVKIKDYEINLDSIPIRQVSRINAKTGLKDAQNNSNEKYLLLQCNDNKEHLLVAESTSSGSSEVFSDQEISLYSKKGMQNWNIKVEKSGIGNSYISDDASIAELHLGNDLINNEYVLIIDGKGKVLNKIDSINEFKGNSNSVFYTKKISKDNWSINYYNVINNKVWSRIFKEQVTIIASSKISNCFIVKAGNQVYSYKGDSLLWISDKYYGIIDITSNGNYILWTIDDSNILLIDNFQNKEIINYAKVVNFKSSLNYAKFVINKDNSVVICGNILSNSNFGIYDYTGKPFFLYTINQCCLYKNFEVIFNDLSDYDLYHKGYFVSKINPINQ